MNESIKDKIFAELQEADGELDERELCFRVYRAMDSADEMRFLYPQAFRDLLEQGLVEETERGRCKITFKGLAYVAERNT